MTFILLMRQEKEHKSKYWGNSNVIDIFLSSMDALSTTVVSKIKLVFFSR